MKKYIAMLSSVLILGGCVSTPANSNDKNVNSTVPSGSRGDLFVNGIVYITGSPPDKTVKDFSLGTGDPNHTEKLLDAYYQPLSEVLKKRDPVNDANAAFLSGKRYFFWDQRGIFKATRENLFGGVTQAVLTECPDKAQLEGVNFYDENGCQGSKGCESYVSKSEHYRQEWNVTMAKLCKKK